MRKSFLLLKYVLKTFVLFTLVKVKLESNYFSLIHLGFCLVLVGIYPFYLVYQFFLLLSTTGLVCFKLQ